MASMRNAIAFRFFSLGITARTSEVFHRGKRVAAHVRSSSNRKHTTVREHIRAIEHERLRKFAAAPAGDKGPHEMIRLIARLRRRDGRPAGQRGPLASLA